MIDKLNNILKLMNNIKYGFRDSNGNVHIDSDKDYTFELINNYKLKCNNELIDSEYGICWDQVELERYYLEKEGINCESYFIICYDNDMLPTHTFIVARDNSKFYLLEPTWKEYYGVSEYDNIESLFNEIFYRFRKMLNNYNDKIKLFKYLKPDKNYNCMEFYKYCEDSEMVMVIE